MPKIFSYFCIMKEEKFKTKSSTRFIIHWAIPLVLVLVFLILQSFPAIIENYYSTSIYMHIALLMRMCFKWLPVSIGDIIYLLLVFQLIILFFKTIQQFFQKKITQALLFNFIFKSIRLLLWVFIVFNFLWGLNYFRLGIKHQLNLSNTQYTKAELKDLVCDLIHQLNTTRRAIGKDSVLPEMSFKEIVKESGKAYELLANDLPFLDYENKSVKKSLFSAVSHYIGFTGYYNPFTAEAQLSTNVPNIVMPFVACHEIAHQLGYASEDEANFVGYLAAVRSKNILFKYSVYIDLYKYASLDLMLMDIDEMNHWQLDELVRKDLINIRKFYAKQNNDVSPIMSQIYAQYLKANQQERGLNSYNDVISLLIAYKKKYQKI